MKIYQIEIIATCKNQESGLSKTIYLSTNENMNVGMINRKIKEMYNSMDNFTIIINSIHESQLI